MAGRTGKNKVDTDNSIQLAEIMECISDGFLALDREWHIIYVNELAASQVKSTPKDIIGHNFWKRFTRIKGTELESKYRKAMTEKQPLDFEIKGLMTETWYHFRIYPSDYGILVYFQDITERKKAQEAIKQSEEQLKRSQEIAHLGSWELDIIDNRLTWSDEVYRIFGLKPREFGSSYEAFVEAVHPDDRAAVDRAYSGSVREGRDTYEIEHRIVRKSTGEIRYVHEKCQNFRDEKGKIIRSIGMVHDITERRKAEEALFQAKQELERKVEERTAELKHSYSKLQQSEEKYRYILETAGEGIITISPEGVINFVNTRTTEMFEKMKPWVSHSSELIDWLLG